MQFITIRIFLNNTKKMQWSSELDRKLFSTYLFCQTVQKHQLLLSTDYAAVSAVFLLSFLSLKFATRSCDSLLLIQQASLASEHTSYIKLPESADIWCKTCCIPPFLHSRLHNWCIEKYLLTCLILRITFRYLARQGRTYPIRTSAGCYKNNNSIMGPVCSCTSYMRIENTLSCLK